MRHPSPPAELLDPFSRGQFVPAPELLDWMTKTFIEPDGVLANEDHLHLNAARLGALWTNTPCVRNGRNVIGQCEFRPPGGTMGKWQRGRAIYQLHQWFGSELDFLFTFDAPYAATCDDAQFCALVEHELYHAGQAKDEFGGPKFAGESGMPVFCLRGHDVEEFTGVVARYGAVTEELQVFIAAALDEPLVEATRIAQACGTCHA